MARNIFRRADVRCVRLTRAVSCWRCGGPTKRSDQGSLPSDNGTRNTCAFAKEPIVRFPELRMEIEPYSFGWDQELREDVDVFFKVKAPKDSERRIRSFPGAIRGLFASPAYVNGAGRPGSPQELSGHRCASSGAWKLTRGRKDGTPNITFHIVPSDPGVAMTLALGGLGIAVLPLWLTRRSNNRNGLIPIPSSWTPEPISLCALYAGSSRLSSRIHRNRPRPTTQAGSCQGLLY
jgi:DNA-binding transcriptional LysR family regulator